MGLSALLPAGVTELQAGVRRGDDEALPDVRHDLPRREDRAGSVWGQRQRAPRQVTRVGVVITTTSSVSGGSGSARRAR